MKKASISATTVSSDMFFLLDLSLDSGEDHECLLDAFGFFFTMIFYLKQASP
jgi:hypothetical protein